MDDIKEIVAQVDGIEQKDNRISIKTQIDGKTSFMSFFLTKKSDGQQTVAHKAFEDLPVQLGNTYLVAYKEAPNDRKPEYPYKNIMNFKASTEAPQAPTNSVVRDEALEQRVQNLEQQVRHLQSKQPIADVPEEKIEPLGGEPVNVDEIPF